jgi:hypothetical protein
VTAFLRSSNEIRSAGTTVALKPVAGRAAPTGSSRLRRRKTAPGRTSWLPAGHAKAAASLVCLGATLVLILAVQPGCTRSHYRLRADTDAYSILGQKTAGCPWMPPPNYTVLPHPASRFFDPTPIDCPALPTPAPQLYAYSLPDLPLRRYPTQSHSRKATCRDCLRRCPIPSQPPIGFCGAKQTA